MKKFLQNIFLFSVAATVMLLILGWVANKKISAPANYKLDDRVSVLILGNSHPECAFNDTFIRGAKNLAQSAEPYFYVYPKLRKILNSNPQIKTVMVEFSTLDIIKPPYRWTFGDGFVPHLYTKYSHLLDAEQQLLLLRRNPAQYLKTQPLALKQKLFFQGNNAVSSLQWGGYNEQHNNSLSADSNQYKDDATMEYADFNLRYLNAIVQLCREKHIQLFFLRSPVHKKFIRYFEPQYQNILASRFNGIPVIDFSGMSFADDEFKDLGHLNYKGAARASKYLDSVIAAKSMQANVNLQKK